MLRLFFQYREQGSSKVLREWTCYWPGTPRHGERVVIPEGCGAVYATDKDEEEDIPQREITAHVDRVTWLPADGGDESPTVRVSLLG
ncbi:hypothetical protein LCGC14_2098170 [marine sediment metagenome]|uniref:Uncharacterized protein n=1 Tax=marine sediment metagenome TaxID=412755 RepID=A0A0F9EAX5_9ZZZZ